MSLTGRIDVVTRSRASVVGSGDGWLSVATAAACSFTALSGACGQPQERIPDGRTIALEMDLRIGTPDGPPETQFGSIAGIGVDDAGSLYVADGQDYEVRKFDPAGQFLIRFGRQGSGPGEFSKIDGLALLADSRVAVVDGVENRLSLFDSSTGEYREQWTIPRQWLTWSRHTIVRRSSGGAYLGLPPEMDLDGTPVRWPRPIFLAVDEGGNVVDTIRAPEKYVEECGTRSGHAVRSGWYEDIRVLYAPKVVWTITPSGDVVIGCPRELQFDIISPNGSLASSDNVPFKPVPIPDDEINWFLDQIEADRGMAQTRAELNRVAVDPVRQILNYDYPDIKAAFKAITVARDGTLWVRLSQRSTERTIPSGSGVYWQNETGGAFEVFTGSGRHIGRVTLPDDVWIDPDRPPAVAAVITGEHLWALTLDSLDIQHVTRYRIGWPDDLRHRSLQY